MVMTNNDHLEDENDDDVTLRGFGDLSVFPNQRGFVALKQTDDHQELGFRPVEFPAECAEQVITAIRTAAADIMPKPDGDGLGRPT